MTLRFAAPIYPGGRHCLLCGTATVGAVFPPSNPKGQWQWRVWVTANCISQEGHGKSEQSAKNAALAVFKDFLTAAGLQVRP
jgi:hypothetical protein